MQSYRHQDARHTVLVFTKRTLDCDRWRQVLCIEELKKNEVQSDLGGILIWEVRDSLSKKVHLMLISEYSRSSHTHTHIKKKNQSSKY